MIYCAYVNFRCLALAWAGFLFYKQLDWIEQAWEHQLQSFILLSLQVLMVIYFIHLKEYYQTTVKCFHFNSFLFDLKLVFQKQVYQKYIDCFRKPYYQALMTQIDLEYSKSLKLKKTSSILVVNFLFFSIRLNYDYLLFTLETRFYSFHNGLQHCLINSLNKLKRFVTEFENHCSLNCYVMT